MACSPLSLKNTCFQLKRCIFLILGLSSQPLWILRNDTADAELKTRRHIWFKCQLPGIYCSFSSLWQKTAAVQIKIEILKKIKIFISFFLSCFLNFQNIYSLSDKISMYLIIFFYMVTLLLPGATTEQINTNSPCVPCLFSLCYCVMGKTFGRINSLS